MRSRVVLSTLLVLGVLTACGSTATSEGGGDLVGIRRDPPLTANGATLPEVAPETGEFEIKATAPDRLLIMYFGYTNCPDLCPSTFAAIRKGLAELGSDADRVNVAFATVDPKRDTPDVLAAYLDSFFDDRWIALRTEDDAALKRAEEPFLASSTVSTTFDNRIDVAHTATSYVLDSNGTVVVEWGYPIAPEDITGDLRQLFKELA